MKTILLFGAGKSATVLIDYLLRESQENKWKFIIADANKELILSKTGNSPFAEAIQLDINNEDLRGKLVQRAHVVISMLPPDLHFAVAKDCVEYRKHLLTASYLDSRMKSLGDEISNRKLLFLCEMGLDPGIDHMSAMKIIDQVRGKGGKVTSFKSHCGGLVAPESDNNPWHYKISWNPRNIVMAGKAGAVYKENGSVVSEKYEALFVPSRVVEIDRETGLLSWYPNRDSLPYIDIYGLQDAATFIRTTLRYPDFMFGWNNIIALKLTGETPAYDTTGMSIAAFFIRHFEKTDFKSWLNGLAEKDQKLALLQLGYLGLDDDKTMINKGLCSAADVLQFILENKLALSPQDKDMIVMLHEFDFAEEGRKGSIRSSLVVKGTDGSRTAMAKTVGLPLGIAAKLILEGPLPLTGLHIPIRKEIYMPVLDELEKAGIVFLETWS